MAKGTQAKEIVGKKILETFDGSFKYDKEIRIPIMEDGVLLQLKCTLTCAKTNVEQGGENIIPGEQKVLNELNFEESSIKKDIEPTQEEKENVAKLADILGLL